MSLLGEITNSLLKKNKTAKICFIGLDSSGKSSIIRKILTNEFNDTLDKRTLGMTVEKISVNGLNFVTWDLGGQKAFRESLWSTYLKGSQGLVYVIDSSNYSRITEAKTELRNYIFSSQILKNLLILILANKQDLPDALSIKNIQNILEMDKFSFINFEILPISCKTGLNIDSALEWLAKQISSEKYLLKPFASKNYYPINV